MCVSDDVAEITLQRPDSHNALNTAAMLDLRRAFHELELDRNITAVTIEGKGKSFSASADLGEYAGPAEDHEETQQHRQELFRQFYRQVFDLHAPVVAKIHGYCIGAGLILAMYCDLRIAAEGAEFAIPTCEIGQISNGGATRRAIDLLGEGTAKELIYIADYVDATEAQRAGLLNDVIPLETLDDRVTTLVKSIRESGHSAVKTAKRTLNTSIEEASDLERLTEQESAL